MSATFTQTLMLGTGRTPDAPVAPYDSLALAWNALPWHEAPENAFLDATAILGITAHSARADSPVIADNEALAPAEIFPAASTRATDLLSRTLAGNFRPLLIEWLQLCSQCGCRVPVYALTSLLDALGSGKNSGSNAERSFAAGVSGQRGRWLAAQNPSWSWLLASADATHVSLDDAAPAPSAWETGDENERLAWLRVMRARGATEANSARERLLSTWAEEKPEFRVAALEVLATSGLSLADEPFLTAALKDRRKDVRMQAQIALARIPGSAFAVRMCERAEKIFSVKRGLLTKRLEITLPELFDVSWRVDAIEEKPPAGLGEKAHWMRQILSFVPLNHWAKETGLAMDALVKLAQADDEWSGLLLSAWFESQEIYRNPESAAALLPAFLESGNGKKIPAIDPRTDTVVELLAMCSWEQQWRFLEQRRGNNEHVWRWLRTCTKCEPRLLTPAQTTLLQQAITPLLRTYSYALANSSGLFVNLARWLPVESAKDVARVFTDTNPADGTPRKFTETADIFVQAMELRAAMHAAFFEQSQNNTSK